MNGYIALVHYPRDSVEWTATFPDLPGCSARGRSLDEAAANSRGALSEHLTEILSLGRALPRARGPGDMLLSANDDPELARRMVGAVLKAIEPEPASALRLTAAVAGQRGFYGEARPRRRA